MRSQRCQCPGPRLACPSWDLSLRTWRTCTAATRYIYPGSRLCAGSNVPHSHHLPLLPGLARPGAVSYISRLCSQKLQQELEFLEVQEEYIKDEQKNLKKEFLHAQEEVKRIQSIPLVIGQFLEAVDQNTAIVGSTTGVCRGAWGARRLLICSLNNCSVFPAMCQELCWGLETANKARQSTGVSPSILSLMQKWKYVLHSLSPSVHVCVYIIYVVKV